MAHTPGPWLVDRNLVYGLNKRGTNSFTGYFEGESQSDNARLAHAAPDLLAIAKDARHFLNSMVEIARIVGLAGTSEWEALFGTNDGFGLIDEIDAAIAKAEGAQE